MTHAAQAPAKPPAVARMSERTKLLVFSVMALGMFMSLLDVQIVSASLPDIEAGLSASSDEGSWIQTAYLIAEIVMIPLSGFLSRAFSTRWLFTASAAAFTVSSMACGFAWNIESMIVFRAVQGFVGGAMIPTVFATGFTLFQGPRQALTAAILGLVATMAPTLGPTLGGLINDYASWHWLFFINVVPGLLILVLVPIYGRVDDPDPSVLRGFDPFASPLLAVVLGGLEYVLEEGPRWNWFEDDSIRVMSVASAVCGLAFLRRSFTHAKPVLDLRLFADRRFAIGCLFQFVLGIGVFTTVYLMPQFLSRVRGFNSADIGLTVFVVGVFQVTATPFAAALSKRFDNRWLLLFGFSLYAVSLCLIEPLTSQWNGHELFWHQALRGFSSMFCIIPATTMALGAMPQARLKQASGLSNLMRNLGGAIGIAGANTVLNDRYNLHYQNLAETLRRSSRSVTETLDATARSLHGVVTDAGQGSLAALRLLQQLLQREALTMTFSDAFVMMAVLFGTVLVLLPLAGPMPPAGAAAAEAH